jgi:serine/threonine protein kinase
MQVLMDPRAPRTPAADVYAFGLLLLELMTGRPAWCNTPLSGIKRKVLAGIRPDIPRPPAAPARVYELISVCWAQHPPARPSFRKVSSMLDCIVSQLAMQGQEGGSRTPGEVTATAHTTNTVTASPSSTQQAMATAEPALGQDSDSD